MDFATKDKKSKNARGVILGMKGLTRKRNNDIQIV
jgi:hypothetical protein